MKYLAIFLVVVLALLIICGGAGLLAYAWLTTSSSTTLPPAPVDLPLLPTPTLANGGNGSAVLPPVAATPAQATPGQPTPAAPFNGTFLGTLTAGNGTTAPVTLALTQDGTAVSGDIAIGDGLSLDGGSCGAQPVPAGTQRASGQTDPANPNHLDAGATFIVQGFTITLALDAELAADGRTMTTNATIDLPFLCSDPVITGTFVRQ